MCRAEPRQILQVGDGRAEVSYDGEPRWVSAKDMPQLVPGDYVVVYAGEAIELMDRDEAEDILRFNEQLEQMLAEASL